MRSCSRGDQRGRRPSPLSSATRPTPRTRSGRPSSTIYRRPHLGHAPGRREHGAGVLRADRRGRLKLAIEGLDAGYDFVVIDTSPRGPPRRRQRGGFRRGGPLPGGSRDVHYVGPGPAAGRPSPGGTHHLRNRALRLGGSGPHPDAAPEHHPRRRGRAPRDVRGAGVPDDHPPGREDRRGARPVPVGPGLRPALEQAQAYEALVSEIISHRHESKGLGNVPPGLLRPTTPATPETPAEALDDAPGPDEAEGQGRGEAAPDPKANKTTRVGRRADAGRGRDEGPQAQPARRRP